MTLKGRDRLESLRPKEDEKKIPLGWGLDRILKGGIETKIITQIYGPPGVGKTNMSLQGAVCCIREGRKVLFIDTEGGRSVDRIKQISGDDFQKVLENSYFYEPNNFDDQNFIIENLDNLIDESFGLIVLDSAVSFYRLAKNEEKSKEMNRLLSGQLTRLLEVARKYNLAVIITNQVYSSFENGSVEPIGGDILKYGSKTIIELKRNGYKRTSILKRHRCLPEDLKANFVITNEGIKDA